VTLSLQQHGQGWLVVDKDKRVIGAITLVGTQYVPSRGGQRGLPCLKLSTALRMVELAYEEGME
jgi:hypothetical protein